MSVQVKVPSYSHLIMSVSFLTLSLLVITLAVSPLHAKTLVEDEAQPKTSMTFKDNIMPKIYDALPDKTLIMDVLENLLGSDGNESSQPSLKKVKSILTKKFLNAETLKAVLSDKMNIDKDYQKPLQMIASALMKSDKETGEGIMTILGTVIHDVILPKNQNEFEAEKEITEQVGSASNLNTMLLNMAMKIIDGKLGNLNLTFLSQATNLPTDMASLNSTYSTIWMMVKSTWQRILSYVKEENSLETFMQLTPVRIIDNIISLGDDINLMNFLAKKLDQDFAEFLASEVNPYLGPLRDFESFYNFTKESGYNGVIDYFTSEKFTYTVNVISKLISAYLEDTVSDDLLNQYIQFIAFNNTELLNFYKSVLKTEENKLALEGDSKTANNNNTQRLRRDVLESIASTYKMNPGTELNDGPNSRTIDSRQLQTRYGATNPLALANTIYDPSRDGGYGGGGGYGHSGGGYGGGGYSMNTLDPYVILGSLALGTILGFLIFRALRGTGNGRRDIGDGSLSLWDSDLPHQILPWGSSVDRMKRQVNDDTQSFSLPSSLRGDVWSSDPLVTDNFLDDHLDEDDIAHHLNHLWRLYKDTNETACVHSHLCDVMANSTAHHLTGKDSSLPLIMASVGNLLGVAGSGQLMDDVTSSLVFGKSYTCTSQATCHPM
ncbi:hypothetical protein Pmani_019234 [Petrolisthes manimaculis]|uniref:Uncharacterized protein n=1 Tax=Petrolisthes manimaculis TaxID=1843537 RepID=A0AAE1PIL5_9EUCA|nr:hypothetical protein Pmani_019234 [Petrolisthes manimaculis]